MQLKLLMQIKVIVHLDEEEITIKNSDGFLMPRQIM
jgi:hypothetical protein